ncbi:488_t:CDS:2 [Acaulospora colombiana]|uniref:488_t:CDS:1 n=1 Tax=Acaulospora colombiana TaxID=27376 RepID=A0ACA9N5X2_9GLOM|nr:488_t:CDS:2 [Acaulospora colombiana]
MKISKRLMTGVIDENIKNTLQSTIEALHSVCPQKVDKSSIRRSLYDILNKNQAFRKKSAANLKIYGWLTFVKAKFNKSRYDAGRRLADNRSTPPPVQEEFSFSINEQGAFTVESFAARQNPKVNKDFGNADTLCILNFIIDNIEIFTTKSVFHGTNSENAIEIFKEYKKDVRHKMAHGIVNENGRWSDLALQNVSLLACKVVECLNGNYEYTCIYAEREKLNAEIMKKNSTHKCTNISQPTQI